MRISRRADKFGFTLVELLVVVSLVALLIALLLPALGKARDMARATVCLSNQRSAGLALQLYADEHVGIVRQRQDWAGHLKNLGYASNPDVLVCPTQKPFKWKNNSGSYGIRIEGLDAEWTWVQNPTALARDQITLMRFGKMQQEVASASFFLFADTVPLADLTEQTGIWMGFMNALRQHLAHARHLDRANAWALDGHVESLDSRGLNRAGVMWYVDVEGMTAQVQ